MRHGRQMWTLDKTSVKATKGVLWAFSPPSPSYSHPTSRGGRVEGWDGACEDWSDQKTRERQHRGVIGLSDSVSWWNGSVDKPSLLLFPFPFPLFFFPFSFFPFPRPGCGEDEPTGKAFTRGRVRRKDVRLHAHRKWTNRSFGVGADWTTA